jgi:hypothetical protein
MIHLKRLLKASLALSSALRAADAPLDAERKRVSRENQSQKFPRSLSRGTSAWDSLQEELFSIKWRQ